MLGRQPGSWTDFDPLIGRDDELATVLDELERVRLVSLTGMGGSGKTRLAEAAFAIVAAQGRDAWFVDLSGIEAASLVGATILAALRFEGSVAGEPLDVVVDTLKGREALLCLDNVEQIAGIGSVLTSLLREPGIRILTTSRVPLRVRGEVEFAVPTLELPAEPNVAAVERAPAGSLFLTRARALGRLRLLDEKTAVDIWAVLRRVDGLPLAIELAAARTRAMSPAEIGRRLDQRGADGLDAHEGDEHRSLRAIIDWTVGLLSPGERQTLEAVSVCAGFDLDLAQALAPDVDVGDTIESLVALGLVAWVGAYGSDTRFRLLEPIRMSVRRDLTDERRETLQDRHAQRFIDLAEVWDAVSLGGDTPELIDRLDMDADNIRLALDRLDAVDRRQSLRLSSHLAPFWHSRGRLAEGLARFERTAAMENEPSPELARATARAFSLAQWLVGPSQLRALNDRAIAAARESRDIPALIDALASRMIVGQLDGDAITGIDAEAELEGVQESDLDLRSRMELGNLRTWAAGAKYGEESDEYVDRLRAHLAEASIAAWPGLEAARACNLAQVLLVRGEHAEAAVLGERAVGLFRQGGRPAKLGWALSYLAASLAELGRVSEAIGAAIEAAGIAVSLRLPHNVGDVALTSMPVALATDQPLLAARLWGVVRAMGERGEHGLGATDERLGARWLAQASNATTNLATELATREGEAEDPLELLRVLPDLLRATPGRSASTPRVRHGELTKREVEILTLVGQGKSDPEIADTLFISPKTASVHVANVKGKLGVDSRLEVALRARELGLT